MRVKSAGTRRPSAALRVGQRIAGMQAFAHGAGRSPASQCVPILNAAHAVSVDIVRVTNNERDFASYPDVKLENWLTRLSCSARRKDSWRPFAGW
ncbi:protein of unknown function [Burkholderia multivorans]